MPTPQPSDYPCGVINRDRMPRDVYVLAIIAFLVAVGFGVMIPVLPTFARSFGANIMQVGFIISAFALMRLVTSPFCAGINEAIGERTALGIGMFIVAASTGGAGLSQNFWQLLLLRGLGGIGSAMFSVAAMTLLLRAVGPSRRGRASAFYSGGFLLGGMAGPAIGGLLAAISLTAPFFFYAVMLAVAGVIGLFLLSPPAPRDAERTRTPLLDVAFIRTLMGSQAFRTASLANLAQGWQSQGVRSALVPIIIVEMLGLAPAATGVTLAIAAVAQGVMLGPIGHLVDTVGRRPWLIIGTLTCTAASLAVPFSRNIVILTVVLCVWGIGSAMVSTSSTAVVGDVAETSGGTPVAVYQMAADLGAIIGPIVAGVLADAFSIPMAFVVGSILLAASSMTALSMRETLTADTN